MPLTHPESLPVALEWLRRPIEAFATPRPGDEDFKASMLGLADQLEELWSQGEDDTLDSDVVWTVLYSFSALTIPGPPPEKLVELAIGGVPPDEDKWCIVMDAETAATLRTLNKIRRMLRAFEPPGLTAALWRAALLAIYGMIELFVLLDDQHGTDQCFELLDVAEGMADKFSGKA